MTSMADASICGAQLQYELMDDKSACVRDAAEKLAVERTCPNALAGLRSFKVLTSNVHKGFGFLSRRFVLRELRDAVREVGADIVFLQEVLGSHAGHAKRVHNWPDAPQYEFLADTLWPNFAYGRNSVYPEGHHGNALLSKFPIVRFDNHDVSAHGDEKRGVLHAVIQNPSIRREIHVCCVHFGLTESHREAQLRLLRNIVVLQVPDNAPLIVAGDFNDWRFHGHRFLMSQLGLHEVFADAYGRLPKTFPARWPMLCLDRIYVRNAEGHSPVVLPRKPWAHLSDHAPLVAEIRL